jgi:hypothetical protein
MISFLTIKSRVFNGSTTSGAMREEVSLVTTWALARQSKSVVTCKDCFKMSLSRRY